MKKYSVIIAVILAILIFMAYYFSAALKSPEMTDNRPGHKGNISVEEAIASRRSERSFIDRALTKDQLMQLLWAAQGITGDGKRAAPSAGAAYPLEVYAAVGKVEGLETGIYRYVPGDHELISHLLKDVRKEVAKASLDQSFIADVPLVIIIAAEYSRTTKRYGERGIRYVHIEVGHVGQNISVNFFPGALKPVPLFKYLGRHNNSA